MSEKVSKSIKSFTLRHRHVDRMKSYIVKYSSIALQNQVKLFREEVDGYLQLLTLKKLIFLCVLRLGPY